MQDIILLKQGEIVLKGLNKKYFEQKLISNVKRRLRSLGEFDVTCTQSTIYVEPKSDDIDMDETQQAMTKVFGIAAVVRAAACDKTPEAMAQKAIEYMAEAMREAGSFKVETRRADKAFPMTSIEVSQYVGGELAEAFPETAVDVHNPELTVHVEVRERAAYIHRPRFRERSESISRRKKRPAGDIPEARRSKSPAERPSSTAPTGTAKSSRPSRFSRTGSIWRPEPGAAKSSSGCIRAGANRSAS